MKQKIDETYNIIGLMSGTSMDGIDATVLKTNGKEFIRTSIYSTKKYQEKTKSLLYEAQVDPLEFLKKKKSTLLDKYVTLDHFSAITDLLQKGRFINKIDFIGFHGQTIYHSFEKKISLQVGNPQLLSNLTNIKVVSSFRENDLKNGGHGAPLSPVYHMAMAKEMKLKLPVVFFNIGGVANVTYCDKKELIGFDTGPGNGLIDKLMQLKFKKNYDYNGELASKGKVNKKIFNKLKHDSYFKKKFPKSLDKLYFVNYLNEMLQADISTVDILATLTEITAYTIYMSLRILPRKAKTIIILGGGQYNVYLMKRITNFLDQDIFLSQDLNLPSNYIEAELFAYLAARTLNNFPITFPLTTGVESPLIGGKIFSPS